MSFVPAHQPSLPASAEAWCLCFVERDLLLPDDGSMLAPVAAETIEEQALARHYLGTLAGVDCWALAVAQPPPGWRRVPLRSAMMAFDATLSGLAGRAAQVLEWDRTHRHCGVCGTPTQIRPTERARVCLACEHVAYPRLSPAMMALVRRPGELLLARSPAFAAGRYSALAGFVEPGESLEDCVHREVAEEVGVTVRELRYYGSQSWPFPHSLMVAFTARWDGGDITPQAGEIEDARWFALDALPDIPPRFSISGHLIRDTVEAMQRGAA